MKKFLFVLFAAVAMVFFSATAEAQVSSPLKQSKVSADTAIDATTVYVTLTAAPDNLVSISAVIKKVSGTVAGTVLLQGTADGTNWVDVNTDTLTLANSATNVKVWPIEHVSYYSYRIALTTTGTQRSIPTLAYVRRLAH